jgi:hypothetical protein
MVLSYGRIASVFAATMLALGMLDSLNLVPFGTDHDFHSLPRSTAKNSQKPWAVPGCSPIVRFQYFGGELEMFEQPPYFKIKEQSYASSSKLQYFILW